MKLNRLRVCSVLIGAMVASPALAQDPAAKVTVQWDKVIRTTQTTPTLQVVVNPPLRRGTPVDDNAFKSLRDLCADYVRYVPWLPYPKLGVAELEPPKEGKTSWDFSLIDPMTIDFLEATKGHSVILNFSTIPQWMYKTEKPVTYPADPNQVTWSYEQGTELRDPSMKEVADYFARLVAWYTQGGFTDEFGKRHESGYHYSIPYWEVLNEVEFEHHIDAETYTRLSPATKTTIDELGVISADDAAQGEPGHIAKPIPNSYWNLAGALYAYLFAELTRIGVDVAGESQLVGFPTQFPSVSMVDWNDGRPNARYWVLKLLHDTFGPGDKLVTIEPFSPFAANHPYVYSAAFLTHDGKHRVLLVNKRDRSFDVSIPGASGGQVTYVDQTTGFQPPASSKLTGENLKIGGYSVAVVTLP